MSLRGNKIGLAEGPDLPRTEGHLSDATSHTRPVVAARFDEPNLVSAAGLVPVMRLARDAGLGVLADELLSVPTDKGANAGGKITALVAGMTAGGDCIDDMALLRHGAMCRVFDRPYAPSTLGSFLRAFTFGHVRQLDAVASRFLAGTPARTHRTATSPPGHRWWPTSTGRCCSMWTTW
jgi:hypothetical protein